MFLSVDGMLELDVTFLTSRASMGKDMQCGMVVLGLMQFPKRLCLFSLIRSVHCCVRNKLLGWPKIINADDGNLLVFIRLVAVETFHLDTCVASRFQAWFSWHHHSCVYVDECSSPLATSSLLILSSSLSIFVGQLL